MTAMRLKRYPSAGGGIALGKMGVGATMLGGWKNPYVTDGLVAMWDGEWNAGGGVHDANATEWVDCVNGKVATFGGSYVIGQNVITASEVISAPLDVGETIAAAIRNGALTCEAVMIPRDVETHMTPFRITDENYESQILGYSFNNRVNADIRVDVMGATKAQATTSYQGDVGWYSGYVQSIYLYVSGRRFYSTIKCAKGSWNANSTSNFTPNSTAVGHFVFGGNWASIDWAPSKEYYCLRFYNRVITTAEKNANKEVDVERFGCVRW